ncbi:MAG TPA: DUF2511 domain-containing protein [Cyclobacteriaceae bacterium]|jgi:hypothetical protein|nr:DUF2511 domain-containing protein [Cyclobacteriaceae bacterium]
MKYLQLSRWQRLLPIFYKPIILIFLALIDLLSSCNNPVNNTRQHSSEKMIHRKDYGVDWPFTVDQGTLKCISNSVVFIANGKTYAVNGTALSLASRNGYENMEEIWAPDTVMIKKLMGLDFSENEALESGIKVSNYQIKSITNFKNKKYYEIYTM